MFFKKEKNESESNTKGLFQRLKDGLNKTTKELGNKLDGLLVGYGKIDDDLYEELEEILIMSDVGYDATINALEKLKQKVKENRVEDAAQVKSLLKEVLIELLTVEQSDHELNLLSDPTVILIVGVNGVGKTTTIGKLTDYCKKQNKNVLLAAGDTFRAGAIDQLEIWGNRSSTPVVKHQEGSDPAAVIFDAIQSAKAKETQVLICDTAGRLHNKKNLMNELNKIFRIVDREYSEANKEVLLVLDATTGQNAIQQAKTFGEVAPITGIVLTKLDGTAKGGIIIQIAQTLGVPVKFIGVGENIEDLQPFEAESFVNALLDR
ncbi:signal recognition particle-docking protein FtsY [Tindallia californiensis]|uniref:Signal recognition particle receptor FtsY n=1 Tax=Tindallia californiensis TaxID=159292 RepID=A0A1H3NTL3_9FIRM|nr:signal recognition particle-docking protein FtsY [Tindallia californiensis]SDY92138.1 signal recognition particle-docking protein FtsY [Tindallia californiensis]